jgi:predicted transcriptional regulator
MKSLTVRLPDALAHRIEQESVARRVSKSEIVREHLDQAAPQLLKEDGLREILEESWAAEVPDQPVRYKSPKKQMLAELIRAKKLHH